MKNEERVNFLVQNLQLLPHPEGGFYKETYRTQESIQTLDGERNLMTSIYFLLTSDHVSRFHRIKSDEHWYFHEGNCLTIHLLSNKGHEKLELGPLSQKSKPYHFVPANVIFGSSIEDQGGYALVSCVVAPGFDFKDFKLFTAEELLRDFPNHSEIITQLT
jgi:predicted cupin superfamily sugar epimerase